MTILALANDTNGDVGLAFKDIRPGDEGQFFELFAAVRGEELGMERWDPQMRNEMLRFQFDAQRRGYREQCPTADERLILRGGAQIGWVIIDRSGPAVHCVDLAIVSGQRNKGVGTQVLRALQEEAATGNRPLLLTVLRTNARALALYARLGFRVIGETDVHAVMEWRR